MMRNTYPISAAAAGAQLGVSRQTTSETCTRLGLGQRLGPSKYSPLMLSAMDFRLLSREIRKNSKKSIFLPGNDLWKNRKANQELS